MNLVSLLNNMRNIGGYAPQMPLSSNARWPVSSSIPIYVFGHVPNTNQILKFDDNLASDMSDSSMWFKGVEQDFIPTGNLSTNKDDEAGYFVATGLSPTYNFTIISYNAAAPATVVGTTRVDFIEPNLAFLPNKTTYPADDIVAIRFTDLAPNQQYEITIDAGIVSQVIKQADDNGIIQFAYVIPHGVHIPSPADPNHPDYHPPVPIEIYALDYGRGNNPNKITQKSLWVFTLLP